MSIPPNNLIDALVAKIADFERTQGCKPTRVCLSTDLLAYARKKREYQWLAPDAPQTLLGLTIVEVAGTGVLDVQ
jgi:hypothetical protein